MTVDDLLALNEEIAALVRAGVPLEQGLADLGADLPGRLGQAVTALAKRTARGESLEQALADQAISLSPAYQAVVQAGLRAGRLPAALEAVAASAHRTAETQHAAIVAVSYPLLVFSLVWLGLAVFSQTLAHSLAESFDAMNVPGRGVFAALAWLGRWAWFWGPVVPIVLAVFVFLWWFACTRAAAVHSRRADRLLGWLPGMKRVLRFSRTATFLEILALLIENRDSLGRSGDAGRFRLRRSADGSRRPAVERDDPARPDAAVCRRCGLSAADELAGAGGRPRRGAFAGAATFRRHLPSPRAEPVRVGSRAAAGPVHGCDRRQHHRRIRPGVVRPLCNDVEGFGTMNCRRRLRSLIVTLFPEIGDGSRLLQDDIL